MTQPPASQPPAPTPPTSPPEPPLPPESEIAEVEAFALELARLAGERITATLQQEISVEYKDEGDGSRPPRDPVSEVDHAIERFLRERVAERFPAHCFIGEEVDSHPDPGDEFVWVVDPVDGTTNFVNGFPLYAASIGVLHRGRPIVGAIWCSTSHALRPGVYHARLGGELRFEGEPVPHGRPSNGVARHLGAGPGGASLRFRRDWDIRVTGSAAIECAFVAAGIFRSAFFGGPSIWDVAGGVCLVRVAGLTALTRGARGWEPLDRFEAPGSVREDRDPSLRDWRQLLILGTPDATAQLQAFASRRSLPRRALRWARSLRRRSLPRRGLRR